MPPQPEASVIKAVCYPEDYCASQLARAVEDTDAHLINLNVTDTRLSDGRIVVELRINRSNSVAAARSLERYGYEVLADSSAGSENADGSGNIEDTLRLRAAELLHIINI